MIDLYELFNDKYGLYYLKNNKKNRLSVIEEQNKQAVNVFNYYNFVDYETRVNYLKAKYIFYSIIELNGKKYIKLNCGGCVDNNININ